MKNNKIALIYPISIFVLTAFISAFLFQNVSAQETIGTNVVTTADTINKTDNPNIGNLIYENKGEITSQTVLEGPTVQTSFSSNGTILNGINSIDVTEIGTYTTTPRSNGVVYGEGQGVITGKNNEIVTWSSQEIGIITPEKKIKFNGSIFFRALSPIGNLAFLDNKMGIFTFEVDASKNTVTKVWVVS
ncbi:MAG TPA: hypothetical protein VE524_05360 [Nitrososphaeraceae archaeon]|nr:hypothetical protein [Nitrososphaeraceae archaeon]